MKSSEIPWFQLQVNWMKRNGFGGWMVWDLDMDDFDGRFCGQGRYPLIRKLNEVLAETTSDRVTTAPPTIRGRTTSTRLPSSRSVTTRLPSSRSVTTSTQRTPERTSLPEKNRTTTQANVKPSPSQTTVPASRRSSPVDITTESLPQNPPEAGDERVVLFIKPGCGIVLPNENVLVVMIMMSMAIN